MYAGKFNFPLNEKKQFTVMRVGFLPLEIPQLFNEWSESN